MALKNRLSKENSGSDASGLFDGGKPAPPKKKEKGGRRQSLGSPGNSPKGGGAKENKNNNGEMRLNASNDVTLETPPAKGLLRSPGSNNGGSPSSPQQFSDNVVGSPYWMAPEVIEMTGGVTTAADIWSVGCTLIELLTTLKT